MSGQRYRGADPLPHGRKYFHTIADVIGAKVELAEIQLQLRRLERGYGDLTEKRRNLETKRLRARQARLLLAFDHMEDQHATTSRRRESANSPQQSGATPKENGPMVAETIEPLDLGTEPRVTCKPSVDPLQGIND